MAGVEIEQMILIIVIAFRHLGMSMKDKEKESRFPVIDFGNVKRSFIAHNDFNSVDVKCKSLDESNVDDNSFSYYDPHVLVELRQQLAELRQRVDGIKEEGTRSQAVVIIEEMEEAATADLRKFPQLYQKCFGLLKDHAELITTLTDLGASLGL
jgi:hypothetical protein